MYKINKAIRDRPLVYAHVCGRVNGVKGGVTMSPNGSGDHVMVGAQDGGRDYVLSKSCVSQRSYNNGGHVAHMLTGVVTSKDE